MNVLRYVLEAAYFISLLTKSKNIMHRLKKYKSKINGFTFMLNVYISRECPGYLNSQQRKKLKKTVTGSLETKIH